MEYGIVNKNKIMPWGITVLIAALVSLFVLSAPANAGVSPAVGRYVGDNGEAIVGETKLIFVNATNGVISEGRIINESYGIDIPFWNGYFDSSDVVYRNKLRKACNESKSNKIECKVVNMTNRSEIYLEKIWFQLPDLNAITKVNGEYFIWVTRGANITFEATTTNLRRVIAGPLPNKISYKLIDPLGRRLYEVNGVLLSDISLNESDKSSITINTTGLELGEYKLSIETDPATNNGLDAEGPAASFEVRSKGVTIKANKQKQTVTKDIVFTIKTTPHTNITLNVTWGMPSKVWFKPKTGDGQITRGGYGNASGTSKYENRNEANLEAEAVFDATGSFEITATEGIMGTTDSISVEIVPYNASVYVDKELVKKPPIYHIGENVKITGSATAGENIVIKVDDKVVKWDAAIEGFEYTWKTEGKLPGLYKVAIWVLPFSDPFQDPPDASKCIYLVRGGLNAKPSTGFVAQGDDFNISGKAEGRDRVDILIIAPRGGSGHGLNYTQIFKDTGGKLDAPGIIRVICGLSTDGKFKTDNITVPKDADTGMYMIVVLNYGRDRVWGTKTGTSDLIQAISYNYTSNLMIKTQEQILELIIDKTVNQPGSDDLMAVARIKVENPYLRLRDIEDVPLGSEFTVRGITNRKEGTTVVVTVEGPVKLKPQFVKVKKDTEYNNKFETSFSTKGARLGTYIVTADDGDRHQATKTVKFVAPLANVTPPPGIELTPTPAAMPLNQTAVTNRTAAGNVSLAAALQNHGVITAVCIAAVLAAAISGVAVTAVRRKKKVPPYKRKVLHTLPPPPGEKWRRWFKR